MPKPNSGSASASAAIESAVAVGWDIMERCRTHIDVAERTSMSVFGHTIEWNPADIGHGDLGVAMAYSAADELDPDGGWDRLANVHLRKAAEYFQQGPPPPLGLFSGTAALGFVMRAHDRSGQRYRRVTAEIDALLAEQLDAATENINLEDGSATGFYDVISGLTGAITYVFTTDAGQGKLLHSALRALNTLAALALADRPGGLWTTPAKLDESEWAQTESQQSRQLDLGFAHGISGVLNVLSQACDRNLGSPLVAEATERLADILLAASSLGETVDVPYVLLPEASVATARSRYAWCYGNLGAALPFHNSATLRRKHPDIVARLLDTSTRTEEDLRLSDPTLCHGRAGKLVLERIMLGEYTVADNAASLLHLVDPQRTFLLEDSLGIDSPGFLVGSGGAGAALLSLQASNAMPFSRMLTGAWIHM